MSGYYIIVKSLGLLFWVLNGKGYDVLFFIFGDLKVDVFKNEVNNFFDDI